MTRRGTEGFTLIEALVALAVLAVSAVSLLAATQAHLARLDRLETRALAQFTAENMIAERKLGIGGETARTEMLGHAFEVTAARSSTPDPDLDRLDVTVEEPSSGARFGGFIGFVAATDTP